jgi:CSLREA domain-containing protein
MSGFRTFGFAALAALAIAMVWPAARFGPAPPVLAGPAGFVVTKTTDTNDGVCTRRDCSLREAIVAANAAPGADTITLPSGVFKLTRGGDDDTAAGGDLDITDAATIVGAGARRTIINAIGIPGGDRVIDVIGAATTLSITGVTIKGGRAGGDLGGGIRSAGPLTVANSTVRGNRAGAGGGIDSAVSLTLKRSTISVNRSTSDCGGLRVVGSAEIVNSTISGNQVTGGGNGAAISVGALGQPTTLKISHVTIANNSSADPARGALSGGSTQVALLERTILSNGSTANCFFLAEESAGHNLASDASCDLDQPGDQVDVDPRLGPLRDNGGSTNTHALLAGSRALDAAGDSTAAIDQRGVARPQGEAADVGAFEREPSDRRRG